MHTFAYDRFYTNIRSSVVEEEEKVELQGNKRRNTLHTEIVLGAG
jgi:hypothetical protein